jgi:hypothetical protein
MQKRPPDRAAFPVLVRNSREVVGVHWRLTRSTWPYSDQSHRTETQMKDRITWLVLVSLLFASLRALAQQCPNVPHPGSADNSASINTDSGCVVASGTYVKKGITIRIQGLADVSGSCDLMGLNNQESPPACEPYRTETNTVDHLTLWKDDAVTGWISGWQTPQHFPNFDTHSSSTTGPMHDAPEVGTHTYFHHSVNNISPNCSQCRKLPANV